MITLSFSVKQLIFFDHAHFLHQFLVLTRLPISSISQETQSNVVNIALLVQLRAQARDLLLVVLVPLFGAFKHRGQVEERLIAFMLALALLFVMLLSLLVHIRLELRECEFRGRQIGFVYVSPRRRRHYFLFNDVVSTRRSTAARRVASALCFFNVLRCAALRGSARSASGCLACLASCRAVPDNKQQQTAVLQINPQQPPPSRQSSLLLL